MQLTQTAHLMEAAVQAQLRLADPELAAIGSELLEVLRPAIRLTLMEVVEMAAQEVNGQLAGQRIEIQMIDGEPELTVRPDQSAIPPPPPPSGEPVDAEARITLRLPGYLKDLIAEAAEGAGDSVNAFVVDALRSKAYERAPSSSVRRTIDL
jgi:hypothetical protein